MSLENGLWRLIFKLHEEEQDELEEMFKWVRQTYVGELEFHIGNKIYSEKVVTFNPTKRKFISKYDNPRSNDYRGAVMVKRKEVSIVVDPAHVTSFQSLTAVGTNVEWIGAILKHRATKEMAWHFGMRNAIVVGKADTFRGLLFYRIVCEAIVELVPKNLAPVPLKWRVPSMEVEPLF